MRCVQAAVTLVAVGSGVSALAQDITLDWPTGQFQPYALDSGAVSNPAVISAEVYSEEISVNGASWLRLYFGQGTNLGPGSFIRVTSRLDNEVQELDAGALALWSDTTAYFNGDTLLLELVAGPSTDNRVTLDRVALQMGPQEAGGLGQCGICGFDGRVPSDEMWTSRLFPAGCTASVWNERSCMVSAGHCVGGSMVVQFNVPDSNLNCSTNNPPIADQFPIVESSFTNGGVGNDWSVLIPGVNFLGELPYDRYGEFRPIASEPATAGDAVELTGYGVDLTCILSQTQQTADGTICLVFANYYDFAVDLRGGNSGSALIHNDEIIGIATHCPCCNKATRVDLTAFADARDELCGAGLEFSFPESLLGVVDSEGGDTVRVVVSAAASEPQPGTGNFHLSVDGGKFTVTPMSENAPNDYEATFPATPCGAELSFFFSAETTDGTLLTVPETAPVQHYDAFSGANVVKVFDDDFEADLGWEVLDEAADGQWERRDPVSLKVCDRGNPGSDADGSGFCYVTDDDTFVCNSDVDGGSTTLTSPVMDASQGDPVISYWRWFSTTVGDNPEQDIFEVEVSANGGNTWVDLETVGPTGPEVDGGWFFKSFRVSDFVNPTSQFRIRFIASDLDLPSIVEAGVDGVSLASTDCDLTPCPWDLDGSGDVGITDFLELLAAWGPNPGHPADFDNDDDVGITDFLKLLANWGPCP